MILRNNRKIIYRRPASQIEFINEKHLTPGLYNINNMRTKNGN